MMLQKKQKGDQECVRETGGTVNCASFPKVAKEGFNDERHPHACTSDQFSFIEHLLQTGPYFSHRMSKMVREMKKTWSLSSWYCRGHGHPEPSEKRSVFSRSIPRTAPYPSLSLYGHLLSFSAEETGRVGDRSPGGKLAESFLAGRTVPDP